MQAFEVCFMCERWNVSGRVSACGHCAAHRQTLASGKPIPVQHLTSLSLSRSLTLPLSLLYTLHLPLTAPVKPLSCAHTHTHTHTHTHIHIHTLETLNYTLKGIVQAKMNISWRCPHSQAIQDVDEFVSSSDLEKCSITSLAQQWMLCSEWVPSEWESKHLIKTSQ